MARTDASQEAPKRLLLYARASTVEQKVTIAAQHGRLSIEADHRGYETVDFLADQASGKDQNRPKWRKALAMLKRGEADGIMVTRLDRMSRSTEDAAQIFKLFADNGWALVMLEPNVDTSTPYGLAFAGVAAVFAQLERDLISARTKEAMAELKSQGRRFGTTVLMDLAIEDRIWQDRHYGNKPPSQIAAELTAEGIPTPSGMAVWTRQTVHAAYKRRLFEHEHGTKARRAS